MYYSTPCLPFPCFLDKQITLPYICVKSFKVHQCLMSAIVLLYATFSLALWLNLNITCSLNVQEKCNNIVSQRVSPLSLEITNRFTVTHPPSLCKALHMVPIDELHPTNVGFLLDIGLLAHVSSDTNFNKSSELLHPHI